MASLTTYDVQTPAVGITELNIKFFPAADADPTYVDPGGVVTSIVYSAAGKYTITLRDQFYALIGFHTTLALNADDVDLYAQPGAVDLTAKTFVVKLKTGTSNTQPPAANANNFVSVKLVFQESSVTT